MTDDRSDAPDASAATDDDGPVEPAVTDGGHDRGADGGPERGDDGGARSDTTADAAASGEGAGGAAAAGHGEDGQATPPARGMLVERAAAAGVEPGPPPRRTGVFVDVEELRSHVGALLRTMLGGYEVDALGNFTFASDGARIFTTVGPGPMGPHVGVFSIVRVDVPLTPDLAGFLLTTNHRLAFGAFSYEPEQRAVWLRHSLLGATLDGPELRTAVISVASTAAKVTQVLRERFGGGSYADASEERRATVHPPEPGNEDDDPVGTTGYL